MSYSEDDSNLARLGYKQEFKRAFTPLEVFGIAFNIIGLFPSIAYVSLTLAYTRSSVRIQINSSLVTAKRWLGGVGVGCTSDVLPSASINYPNSMSVVDGLRIVRAGHSMRFGRTKFCCAYSRRTVLLDLQICAA